MTTPPRRLLLAALLAACPGGDPSATDAGSTGSSGDATSGATSGAPVPTSGDATGGSSGDVTGETGESSGGEAVGCDGAPLLALPADTSARGPWPVGARTASVGGLTVEVWYPAEPGSARGAEPVRYDIRTSLPASEQGKVPDADNPWQDCECHRDLPIDAAHGPYPAVIFVHGTAGFRSQSLEHVTHWASRGFVVVAADHPGLYLADLIGMLCGVDPPAQDLGGDLDALVAAISAPAGELEFLAGRVDAGRIAMAGHSAGGGAIEGGGDVAQVLIPMAAGGTTAGAALRSTLVLGAQADKVVPYTSQQDGYDASPAPRRLVGIRNAGHLAFSSLCSLRNADGQDFVEIAQAYDVCGAQFASLLFDCRDEYTPDPASWAIVHYATSAALEETLHCSDAGKNFAELPAKFAEVGEFREDL